MDGDGTFSFSSLVNSFVNLAKNIETLQRLPIDGFISSYKELIRLFDVLGRGFGFVKSDLVEKTEILELIAEKNSERFTTIEEMVKYEVDNNLTVVYTKDGNNYSGSRTLVRLVRALDFIKLLLQYIEERTTLELGQCAREAYDRTLALYHPWAIRKAAGLAFHILPSKQNFVKHIYPESPSNESTMRDIHDLQCSVGVVLKNTKDLLTMYNLNDLP